MRTRPKYRYGQPRIAQARPDPCMNPTRAWRYRSFGHQPIKGLAGLYATKLSIDRGGTYGGNPPRHLRFRRRIVASQFLVASDEKITCACCISNEFAIGTLWEEVPLAMIHLHRQAFVEPGRYPGKVRPSTDASEQLRMHQFVGHDIRGSTFRSYKHAGASTDNLHAPVFIEKQHP